MSNFTTISKDNMLMQDLQREETAVGSFIRPALSVPPDMITSRIADYFFRFPKVDTLAVVDETKPVALVTRQKLMAKLFYRFGQDLFGKHPIISLADTSPLIINESESLDVVIAKAIDRDTSVAYDDIVVIDESGCFKGLLFMKELVIQQSNILAKKVAQNQQMIEMLKELAHQDPLTGLFNKRHFFEIGAALHNAALRNNFKIAVFVADIDNFKQVNDTYGHDAGDIVLIRTAQLLKNIFRRQDDIIGRFGGDEFCAIVLFNDMSFLHALADKLRHHVQQQTVVYGSERIRITVSLGCCAKKLTTLKDMIKNADALLYEAKRSGKNTACVL